MFFFYYYYLRPRWLQTPKKIDFFLTFYIWQQIYFHGDNYIKRKGGFISEFGDVFEDESFLYLLAWNDLDPTARS